MIYLQYGKKAKDRNYIGYIRTHIVRNNVMICYNQEEHRITIADHTQMTKTAPLKDAAFQLIL